QNSYQRIDSQRAPTESPFETGADIGTHHIQDPSPNPPLMPDDLAQFNLDLHRSNYIVSGSVISGSNEERLQSFRQHVTSELALDIVASMANQALFAGPSREFAEQFNGAYGPQSASDALNIRSYNIENINQYGVNIKYDYKFEIGSFLILETGDSILPPAGRKFQASMSFSMFASVDEAGVSSDNTDKLFFSSRYTNPPSLTISEIDLNPPKVDMPSTNTSAGGWWKWLKSKVSVLWQSLRSFFGQRSSVYQPI
uniref:hypothetical protein n=1 Tax=Shewanella sp. S23-S33 TaxID=3342769 RepID=UPI00372D2E6B